MTVIDASRPDASRPDGRVAFVIGGQALAPGLTEAGADLVVLGVPSSDESRDRVLELGRRCEPSTLELWGTTPESSKR